MSSNISINQKENNLFYFIFQECRYPGELQYLRSICGSSLILRMKKVSYLSFEILLIQLSSSFFQAHFLKKIDRHYYSVIVGYSFFMSDITKLAMK